MKAALFYEFYTTLLALADKYKDHSQAVQYIQEELIQFFDNQTIAHNDYHDKSNFDNARYSMIGFADEFFLNLEWAYKLEWLNNLLEAKVFRTHISGSHIFEQIDYILEDRENTELARIYFYVLSFGFKGMHINNQPKIDQLKSQLFFMIYQQHPTTELNKLFETVIGESKTRKQYTTYHLLWFCVTSLCIYLLVSYVIWYTYTDSLNQVIARFAL